MLKIRKRKWYSVEISDTNLTQEKGNIVGRGLEVDEARKGGHHLKEKNIFVIFGIVVIKREGRPSLKRKKYICYLWHYCHQTQSVNEGKLLSSIPD